MFLYTQYPEMDEDVREITYILHDPPNHDMYQNGHVYHQTIPIFKKINWCPYLLVDSPWIYGVPYTSGLSESHAMEYYNTIKNRVMKRRPFYDIESKQWLQGVKPILPKEAFGWR